jgi:hypothetical protein
MTDKPQADWNPRAESVLNDQIAGVRHHAAELSGGPQRVPALVFVPA